MRAAMECFTTFTGEDFNPLSPDIDKIKIEDIAHSLSLMCRANGHFSRFYSVAQHCINCANEAEARDFSDRVQLACLLHDASEAYMSDITRLVKKHLPVYIEAEEYLQNIIYSKFLGTPLTDKEYSYVKQIDDDMLVCEFDALMTKKVFERVVDIKSSPSFEFTNFSDIKAEFIRKYKRLSVHKKAALPLSTSQTKSNFLEDKKAAPPRVSYRRRTMSEASVSRPSNLLANKKSPQFAKKLW